MNIKIIVNCDTIMNQSTYKIVLIGDSNSGKTCLFTRILRNSFYSNVGVTICASFGRKEIIIENNTVCLDIWDTIGNEAYRNVNKLFYKNANIIFLMYNIANRMTFESIKSYHYETVKKIAENASMNILIMIYSINFNWKFM